MNEKNCDTSIYCTIISISYKLFTNKVDLKQN